MSATKSILRHAVAHPLAALSAAAASLCAIAGLALALATPAHAAGPAAKATVLDVDTFLAYQRTVRDEVTGGRRFRHLDNETKRKLFRAQDELFGLLDGKESIDDLSEGDKVSVYNAQHVVAAVLADAELDREVCKRERALGSHRVTTTCMTIRERNEMRELSHTVVRNIKPYSCTEVCPQSRMRSVEGGAQ